MLFPGAAKLIAFGVAFSALFAQAVAEPPTAANLGRVLGEIEAAAGGYFGYSIGREKFINQRNYDGKQIDIWEVTIRRSLRDDALDWNSPEANRFLTSNPQYRPYAEVSVKVVAPAGTDRKRVPVEGWITDLQRQQIFTRLRVADETVAGLSAVEEEIKFQEDMDKEDFWNEVFEDAPRISGGEIDRTNADEVVYVFGADLAQLPPEQATQFVENNQIFYGSKLPENVRKAISERLPEQIDKARGEIEEEVSDLDEDDIIIGH